MEYAVFNPQEQVSSKGTTETRYRERKDSSARNIRRQRKVQSNVKSFLEKEEAKKQRYEEIMQFWGDNPDDKDEHDMRITSTNINGLTCAAELSEYIIGSKRFESDVNCFQEINMNTNKSEVCYAMRKAINDVDESKGSTFQTSISPRYSNQRNRNNNKQQGGTMVHIEQKWTGANLRKSNDPLGRWSRITLEGKGERLLSIYSVYRVCNNNLATAGGETVWLQEYKSLLEKGMKNPNPRQQVLDDLESEIISLQEDEKHQIIVCIDANETTRKNKSRIQAFLRHVGMIDAHSTQHPDLQETPTFSEGSNQIDYCFITPGIVPHVKRCGITPLNYAVQGADHRSIWVDIEVDAVLGGVIKDPVGIKPRGLKLQNIKALHKFKERMETYCKQHRMKEKIHTISKGLLDSDKEEDNGKKQTIIQRWATELDKWDQLFTELLLASERKCSKTGLTRTYLWSKPLMMAGQRITYWKARKRGLKCNRDVEHLKGYAKHLHNKFGYTNKRLSKGEIRMELRDAWKNLRAIQKEDRANRQQFLEELAVERAFQQNIQIASAIKQIQNSEETKQSHEKLGRQIKPTERGAIKYILIPDGDNPDGPFGKSWKKITDSEEVEKLLLQRNENKLQESSASPFSTTTTTTLSQNIGHIGDQNIIEDILNNEYCIGEDIKTRRDSREISAFMDQLARYPRDIGSINPIISAEDIRSIFNNTRETTSSSPSGVHIGIWKAALMVDEIADLIAASITLPFLYGFTKERWRHSLHVMLAKMKQPYMHKLRIVQPFEADYNAALKIYYARRMMDKSEKYNQNSDQIYAGRKGNTVHDCLVNLQLTYELAISTQSVMAIIFNNMAGCYNRLRFNLTNITTQRIGMHKNIAKTHTLTLAGMKHRVRTANGDSEQYFQAKEATGGTGQGSGASPPVCHSQLLVMVSTLEKFTPGQLIQDPTKAIKVLQHVISWVDDTVNKEDLPRNLETQEQLHRIREILLHWRNILRITGGDLELSKTVVYLLDYIQEEDGRIRFKTLHETPGEVILEAGNKTESDTKISRREPFQAERYLGVRIAPTGQMGTEFEFRMAQASDLAEKITGIFMSRPEATLIYQSRWLSLLGFYSPITTFTRRQCEQIQTPIYQAILPKMGYNRHTPLAIRYGPPEHGGTGLVHAYTEQVVKHLQFFVGTMRQESQLADTMRIGLSTIQMLVGTSDLFLNKRRKQITYVEGNSRTFFYGKHATNIIYQSK